MRGGRVAILLALAGTEQAEFTQPKKAVEDAGAQVDVVGIHGGEVLTYNNDLDPGKTFTIEKPSPRSPLRTTTPRYCREHRGGRQLVRHDKTVSFVRSFLEQKVLVGVLCHGPCTLLEAGVVRGRTLTSLPALAADRHPQRGGEQVDEEVVTNQGLVISGGPDDVHAFCSNIVEGLAEGKHDEQKKST